MRLFFIAVQFLTIIPLPFAVRCEVRDLGRSMAFFPLVGLALGGLLAGIDFLLAQIFPRQVTDLLLILVITAVTGALHLDGLADVCDGLAARGGRERFLAVMRDSHIGAVGVVGLVLGLLLKYEALLAVPAGMKREALFLFPVIARFSQVQMAVGARQARSDGLGSLFVGGAGKFQFVAAALVTVSVALLFLGWQGVYCMLATTMFTLMLKGWFQRRLGGVTGDVIGCVSELNEMVCLLVLVLLFRGTSS
jgi:adenosylcobinamide-GDP ribazoletransferase